MTEKKKKKRLKKSLGQKAVSWVLIALMVAGIVFFAVNINKEVRTTFSLLADLNESQAELQALEKEKELLQAQKEKLTDENYVSSVARGKYLIFKENEQIYYLPPLED